MLLSLNYLSQHKTDADELRCPINQLGLIFDFIKENPQKRYNILKEKIELTPRILEQIDYVRNVAKDYTIECTSIAELRELIHLGYSAYLKFPVVDWETFQGLRRLRVSDIYIDGPLGFQIQNLIDGKGDVKIRVTPTASPNASLFALPAANHFFIRPEDTLLYSNAIDIFDFRQYDSREAFATKEDVLFEIYKRGSYNMDIKHLIEYAPSANNRTLSDFAENRLNCGQKCMIPGYKCHWCDNYFTFVERAVKYSRSRKS